MKFWWRYTSLSWLAGLVLALGLTACGPQTPTSTPSGNDSKDLYRYGSVLGGEGGINLLGPKRRDEAEAAGGGLGVNSFLWRASLDTLAFMPIASADPFGGVILTDWYSPPNTPNERFKVNVYILGRQLRANGLKVSVFRQNRDGGGQWRDQTTGPETASKMEDTILTRARQLRIAQSGPEK